MKNLLIRQSFLLFIVCCFIVSVGAQNKPAATIQALEKYMERFSTFTDFGGAALVMKGDKILLRKAYGLADREWGVANTVDTKFRIASIAKPFTAVAILKLVEQNKLSLDDTLEKFLPGFQGGDKITIHMMLTHRSGLPRGHDMDVATEMTMTMEKAIEIIRKKPLAFEPGTKSVYSNTGFLLLSLIIEKVSGESYESFLRKNVFQPAGLNHTGIYDPEVIVPKMARFYRPENAAPGARVEKEFFANHLMFQGHGNLYSTIDDLARFLTSLERGTTLLSESSKAKMFTKHYKDSGWDYGYGIDLSQIVGHKAFGHTGGFNGLDCIAFRFPEDDVILIVFSNNKSNTIKIGRALAAITFGQDVEMPYRHVRVPIEPALLDRYAGSYESYILSKDGKLMLEGGIELVPESRTKFFESTNPNNTYEFVVEPDGKVKSVVFSSYGMKRSITRALNDAPWRVLLKAIIEKGATEPLENYLEARRQNPAQNIDEAEINLIGYRLLEFKKIDDAIGVFTQNTIDFPKSANAWDSLAEAYMTKGDNETAIKYYEKSLELDPNNKNAVEQLKKLKP